MGCSEAVALRPHHGPCAQFFEGKGYSEGFVKNMTAVMQDLGGDPSRPVRLWCEADVICAHCPYNCKGTCESGQKVRAYDTAVLRLCALREGDLLSWGEYCARVTERIILPGRLRQVCGGCEWLAIYEGKAVNR